MVRRWWPALLVLAVVGPAARAVDKADVDRAVEKGVQAIKNAQHADGSWSTDPSGDIGPTVLAAWALLECGVSGDDPVLRRTLPKIREASVTTTTTYNISLCIMCLDRLGDRRDVPLIQSLAVRLLAGQGESGGWTYRCPSVSDAEEKRLLEALRERRELQGQSDPKPPGKGGPPEPPREIKDQLDRINQGQRPPAEMKVPLPPGGGQGPGQDIRTRMPADNSNTQFATLALWVSRRHGIPVDDALRKVATRFRTTQNSDGGWGYHNDPLRGGRESTPSMTCAGVLVLAVSYGPAAEKDKDLPTLDKDPAIKAGLQVLGTCIAQPVGKGKAPTLAGFAVSYGGDYYYLWSLERMAMAMGLDTIGNKDWYSWGAEILLSTQKADGSWDGRYSSYGADNCFALLFLRRANVASDLTVVLRGRVKDPGERVLRPGGVGGSALLGEKGSGGTRPDSKQTDAAGSGGAAVPASPEAEAARLGTRLVEANPEQQTAALDQLKAGPGSAYTQALATAIPRLEGDVQKKARQALADRLSGMKAATLRGWLKYEDREIRRAAALACAMKDDKTHVPDLIPLLEDEEPLVARAAYAALKSLTGQDLGPAADASSEERAKAVAAWKDWWKKNGG